MFIPVTQYESTPKSRLKELFDKRSTVILFGSDEKEYNDFEGITIFAFELVKTSSKGFDSFSKLFSKFKISLLLVSSTGMILDGEALFVTAKEYEKLPITNNAARNNDNNLFIKNSFPFNR